MIERVDVTVRTGPFAEAVLPRVISVLSARAGLGVDRVNDALLLADVLASADTGRTSLRVVVERHDEGICVVVPALSAGEAERLIQGATFDGIGSILDGLADRIAVGANGDGEELRVVVGRENV